MVRKISLKIEVIVHATEDYQKIYDSLCDVFEIEPGEITKKDIGIITPYAGQVRAIRNSMNEKLDDVEVKTVDGYQGREKEVIIFSCVRSNPEQNVGFLSEKRRLNVALTRAKRGLIVIGDPATLRGDDNWRAWLEYVRDRKFEAWHLLGMN